MLKTLIIKPNKCKDDPDFVYRAGPDVKKIIRMFRKNIKKQFIKWFGGNENKGRSEKGNHNFHYWNESK